MKNFLILLLVIFATIALVADVKMMTESSYNIRFQLDTSDFNLKTDPEFTSLQVDNLSILEDTGAPQLPQKLIYVAIPPQGSIKVNLINSDQNVINLTNPIIPTPAIFEDGEFYNFDYNINESLYKKPIELFTVGEKTRYRHHTVVPILISPFEYSYDNSKITHYESIELEVVISGDTRYQGNFVDPYLERYPGDILNYNTARNWTTFKTETANHLPFEKSDFWYNIKVENPGVYQLDSSTLAELPAFAELTQLRLFKMVKSVEVLRNDSDNERGYSYIFTEIPLQIAEDELVYFQTETQSANLSLYDDTTENYWLTFGFEDTEQPLRIDDLPGNNNALLVDSFKRKIITPTLRTRSDINNVIIYPDVFLAQAERLANIHLELLGKKSLLVNQQDCFDMYSGGDADPISIRDSLEALFEIYPGTFSHVILLGSGVKTWNPSAEKNKIITFSSNLSNPESGYAIDDEFVDFSGLNLSLAIGRIPAKDETMLNFYLDRVEAYLNKTNSGFWRNNFLMHSDDEKNGDTVEIVSGLDHTALSESTLTKIHDGIVTTKIYGLEYDYDAFQNKPDARDALVEEINNGALIWYYIGHGNPKSLGHETYFKYPDDMSMLDNGSKLNLFIAASCSVGLFDDVNSDCLGEAVLFSGLADYVDGDGGSIASISASDVCSGSGNTNLINYLVEKIVDDRNDIGLALRRAKHLTNSPSNARKYNILGDPTLPVLFPEVSGNITNWPDSLRSRQTISVTGNLGTEAALNSEFHMYESDRYVSYENLTYKVGYVVPGNEFVIGPLQHEDGIFKKSFIVPDDAEATKHLLPIIGFYVAPETTTPTGFILAGDQTSEYLPNYKVFLKSPLYERYDDIKACYLEDGNTVVVLDSSIAGNSQGYEAYDVYVDAWAKAIVYSLDPVTGEDIVTFASPLQISDDKIDVTSASAPEINIYLDSKKFTEGDVVSTKPLLIAELEDENGINLISGSGHGLQIIVDDSGVPVNVTEGFVYDDGSYTKGELSWQLDQLEEGNHTLKIIAFDSFNNPAVQEINFIAKKSGKVSINNMLPYPNPIEKDGHFTFTITEAADITITIFTITGKKIRTLKKPGCSVNFNKVYWNGKDADGDRVANGTYLYKIRAKGLNGSKSSEKTGKVIILK